MAPAASQAQAPGLPPVKDLSDPLERMLSRPALVAPPGADTTMTTDGPDQMWYLVVAIICVAIPGLFLIVRVYTKLAIARAFELADYFIFLAFPLMIVEIINGYFMVKWGAGVHQWQVTQRQLFNQLYWMNTAEIIYCPLSFLVKMAILLQYLRLFAPSRQLNRTMWYGAWITMAACFIFYTIFTFWTMFYCKPRHMIWNKFTPDGKCFDHGPIVISQGAFNMASDIVILLLPTRSLWRLNVPMARKIVVTMLFATGLLACAASTMRIIFTIKIAPVITMSDVSHNGLFIGLWTEAEVALGFIVACSLSLPKLIQAKRKKINHAVSYVSGPFSTMRSTMRTRSSSRSTSKSTTQNSSTHGTSRNSTPMIFVQEEMGARVKRPMFYEERELYARRQTGIYPIREERDAYALPSISGSSNYSQSLASSDDDETLHVAPLNWQPKRQTLEQEVAVIPRISRDRSRSSDGRTAYDEDEAMPRLSVGDWRHSHTRTMRDEEDTFTLPSASRRPSRISYVGGPEEEVEPMPVLNGMNAGGLTMSHRLTQEELFVLQQFNFESFGESIDLERASNYRMSR